jgi:hypothetical protein
MQSDLLPSDLPGSLAVEEQRTTNGSNRQSIFRRTAFSLMLSLLSRLISSDESSPLLVKPERETSFLASISKQCVVMVGQRRMTYSNKKNALFQHETERSLIYIACHI